MNILRLSVLWIAITLVLSACSGNSKTTENTRQLGGAVQGKALPLSAAVTTFAGPTPGAMDGTGTLATFERPSSVTSDGINVYIADSGNHTIRKLVIATGEVTTLAGKAGTPGWADGTGTAARFYAPRGIATDGSHLYVADDSNYTIRKIVIATGVVTTMAGSAGSHGYADGTGTAARFVSFQGIATDGVNLYVADQNRIRKVELSTRAVTTLLGDPAPYETNISVAPLDTVNFGYITGLTTDGTNLYVMDGKTISKVLIATGEVTAFAGSSSSYFEPVDGVGIAARFGYGDGITTDGTNLYVTDSNTVRKIVIATAEVTTLAGQAWMSGYADATGAAARFVRCAGIVAAGGELFVADPDNKVIRKVAVATGVVTTVAGTPAAGSADGPAATASFFHPRGVTTDGKSLFVADSGNCTIRKIDIASGMVTTLAGSPGASGTADGVGPAALFSSPLAITTDGTSLFVTDDFLIREVEIATGTVTTLAGGGSIEIVDGTGTAAGFGYLGAITTDGTSLFVTDLSVIRKVDIATGVVTTLAGSDTSGWADGTGREATFGWNMGGITTDGTSLFVADSGNRLIRKVTIATGEVTTLAGNPTYWGSSDGYGTIATFSLPEGLTTDGNYLYIADSGGRTIRKMELATAEVSTLAGSSSRYANQNGVGASAGFEQPTGITTDGRSLFVTDGIGSIRRIR